MSKKLMSWVVASVPLLIFLWFTLVNVRAGMPAMAFVLISLFAATFAIGVVFSHRWFLKHYPDKPWLAPLVEIGWVAAAAAVWLWLAPRLVW